MFSTFFEQTEQSDGLREDIYDLLLADYYLPEGKFDHCLRIVDGIASLKLWLRKFVNSSKRKN